MLGIQLRNIGMEYCAVDTGNSILIEQSLITVHYSDSLIIITNDRIFLPDVIQTIIRLCMLG